MDLAKKLLNRKPAKQDALCSPDLTNPSASRTQLELPYNVMHSDPKSSTGVSQTTIETDDNVSATQKQVEPTIEHRSTTTVEGREQEGTEDKDEIRRRRNYRIRVVLCLAAPYMLQSLNTTIVATALPNIARDFHQLKQLNWILSAYNLTSATFLPFWTQVVDVFGRFTTIVSAIALVMIGSSISTATPTTTFGVLLLGRGIQGVGCAGMNVTIRSILADRVSLEEYARTWTLFSFIAAISFSIGPIIGGYLTQAHWRWCFAINLPIGSLAMLAIVFVLRKDLVGPQPLHLTKDEDATTSTSKGRFFARLSGIDFGGQMLFFLGFGLVILGLTWAGGLYGWASAQVITTLLTGTILMICWLAYEYLMAPNRLMSRMFPSQQAMIPWELISKRDMILLYFVNMGSTMAMVAVLYFLGLYFVVVEGKTPAQSGVNMLCFLSGLGAGAYMAMFASNVWPKQTHPTILFGSLTSALGITLIVFAIEWRNNSILYGLMALTGHGVGIRMLPGSMHGIALFPHLTAGVCFLGSFASASGGALCLTIMMAVYNNKAGNNHENPVLGIKFAFLAMAVVMWITFITATFLGNVWIQKGGNYEVVTGSYFWSLITGKKLVREHRSRGRTEAENDNSTTIEKKEAAKAESV